jgi:hypothetical protein
MSYYDDDCYYHGDDDVVDWDEGCRMLHSAKCN